MDILNELTTICPRIEERSKRTIPCKFGFCGCQVKGLVRWGIYVTLGETSLIFLTGRCFIRKAGIDVRVSAR